MDERFGGRESIDEVAGAARCFLGFFPRSGVADGVGSRAVGEFEGIGEIAADALDAGEFVFATAGEFGGHIHCADDADEVADSSCGKWLFAAGDHLNECNVLQVEGEHQNYEP